MEAGGRNFGYERVESVHELQVSIRSTSVARKAAG